MRVGVLGGTFNPPHEGHIYLSKIAKKALRLHKVIWLITPQNPQKRSQETPHHSIREKWCAELIRKSGMKYSFNTSNIDYKYKTYETYKSLKVLRGAFRNDEIYWIMGDDNLSSIHTWRGWRQFLRNNIRFFIFNRIIKGQKSLLSEIFLKYYKNEIRYSFAGDVDGSARISFVRGKTNATSSTKIRKSLSKTPINP